MIRHVVVICVIIVLALVQLSHQQGYTVQGVDCKKCRIDCLQSPNHLFSSCQNRYIEYGCNVQDMCLSVNTATDREVNAGITMCILLGGCSFKTSLLASSSANYEFLTSQSSEGKAVNDLENQINQELAKNNGAAASNEQMKAALEAYSSLVSSVEGNHTADPLIDKLLQGKRRALSLLNISPSFFITYMLTQDAQRDVELWRVLFHIGQIEERKTDANNIIFNKARRERNLASAAKFKELCASSINSAKLDDLMILLAPERQKVRPTYWKQEPLDAAKKTLVDWYLLKPLCRLPEVFLASSRIVEDILNVHDRVNYGDLIAQFQYDDSNPSPVNQLHSLILEYADKFSKISVDPVAAPEEYNLVLKSIDSDLITRAMPYGSKLLVTYTCSEYTSDMIIKHCDIQDIGEIAFAGEMKKTCPPGRTFIQNTEHLVSNYTKYCNKAQRTSTEVFGLCYANSLVKIAQKYRIFKNYIKYVKNPRMRRLPPTEMKTEIRDVFWGNYYVCTRAAGAVELQFKSTLADLQTISENGLYLANSMVTGFSNKVFAIDMVNIVNQGPVRFYGGGVQRR